MVEAAIRGTGKAAELIDLTRQTSEHPRIGAADVIPFVPISGITLEKCVLLARQAGLEIWRRFGVPVYFYEAAASRPDRANLENVRQGQFEGLRDAARKEARPPARCGRPGCPPHRRAPAPSAPASSWSPTRSIWIRPTWPWRAPSPREIRAAALGLKGVKALGLAAHGRAQLSLNIGDFQATPVSEVYKAVSRLAARHKTAPVEGEVIGLIPEAACERESEWMRQLIEFDPDGQDSRKPPGGAAGLACAGSVK